MPRGNTSQRSSEYWIDLVVLQKESAVLKFGFLARKEKAEKKLKIEKKAENFVSDFSSRSASRLLVILTRVVQIWVKITQG